MNALAILALVLSSVPANDVVARVDGTPITAAAFARRLESAAAPANPGQILQQMIDEVLLAAEGRRRGLERSPAATAFLDSAQLQQAGVVFLEKEVAGKLAPDEAMLRDLFHSTADFAAYELLVFETAQGAAAAAGRIRHGASFASEASGAITSQVYPDPKRAPLVMRGEVGAPFAAALFDAAPGAVVGPVQLPDGFAVARLLTKVVGTDQELEAKRSSLIAHARSLRTEQLKHHVITLLREKAHVVLDEEFLRSVREGEPTPQVLDHALATVGGKALRYREILDDVRALRVTGGHMGPALRIAVAWRKIDARLIQEAAAERGFLNAPEVVAVRPEHEQQAIGYAAEMRIMDAAPPPTERDISSFYERNSAAFGRPFAQVLPQAAAGAAREKREAALVQGLTALRSRAAISIDRGALARATKPRA